MNYRPTGEGTPQPTLLDSLAGYVGRWIAVAEALPPTRAPVLVAIRGDNCPAFAWLKFAAGDRACPFFVCPQLAALEPRGLRGAREDITHWFAPTEQGLPWMPGINDGAETHSGADWGLSGYGWEMKDAPLNPRRAASEGGGG